MTLATENGNCLEQCPVRDLAHHLFAHSEQERARIAREIHDDFGGALSVIKLEVSRVAATLSPEAAAQRRRLQRAGDLADAAIASLRRIVTELRPAMLDDLGVFAAVEWLGHEFSRRQGLPCHVRLSGEALAVEGERAIAVFRIVEEALDNVARHARATQVWIDLEADDDGIHLIVSDDGIGLPANPLASHGTYGLRGLSELAKSLGGELRFASRPGDGALLVAELPAAKRTP